MAFTDINTEQRFPKTLQERRHNLLLPRLMSREIEV